MDVTREFNAMIGSLNQLEASANSDLYQDYDFVDDVSKEISVDPTTGQGWLAVN